MKVPRQPSRPAVLCKHHSSREKKKGGKEGEHGGVLYFLHDHDQGIAAASTSSQFPSPMARGLWLLPQSSALISGNDRHAKFLNLRRPALSLVVLVKPTIFLCGTNHFNMLLVVSASTAQERLCSSTLIHPLSSVTWSASRDLLEGHCLCFTSSLARPRGG